MAKLKEFSILKWVIFPLNSIILAGVVVWFNMRVFGYADGAPYCAIVALIGLFSIIIVKYSESADKTLARAAFTFEIFLTVALIINAAYSISVQRRMSVARMAETSQADVIDKIGKLRGSRTQREALKVVEKTESAQAVFAGVEQVLFWIAVGELFLYGVAAFSLFALARLRDDEEGEPKADEFPSHLDVEKRQPTTRPRLEKTTTHVSSETDDTDAQRKTTQDDTVSLSEGLRKLRETLRLVSFHHPGVHFKADLKPDCVWVRAMVSDSGIQRTAHAEKASLNILRSALRMKPERFRAQVEAWLQEHGFFEDSEDG